MATKIEYSNDDIIRIAEAQRSLMRAVCGILAIWVSCFFVGLLHLGPLLVILLPLMMFLAGLHTFTLDKAMKSSVASAVIGALLSALLSFGCIGLLVMGMVSSRAGKVLKARGLNGGFMGVSQENLDKWKAANQLESLESNAEQTKAVLKTCPSCGTENNPEAISCKCGRALPG